MFGWKLTKLSFNVFVLIWLILAGILIYLGLVSPWVALLIVLSHIRPTFTISRG